MEFAGESPGECRYASLPSPGEVAGTFSDYSWRPVATLRAKQMWDEWSRNKDHGNDHLGPDGALQLYVRVDVEVHHDDTYAKGKSVRRGDRPMKDATEDQLCKLRKRMLTGHEDFGQATFGISENKLKSSYMHATAVPLSLLVSFWVGRHSATLLWDNLSGSVAEG